MTQKDNPFGGMGGQYNTSVQYGSGGPSPQPAQTLSHSQPPRCQTA